MLNTAPLVQEDDCRVWAAQLQQTESFQSPCSGEDFAALIAVYDASVTNDNRNTLCDALVQQGLRNGVCWGYDCSGWDDALDWAYLATGPEWKSPTWTPPDERFVMTSWFANEPLEEATFYFLRCTGFDEFQPRNFVALMLGNGPLENMSALIKQELAKI